MFSINYLTLFRYWSKYISFSISAELYPTRVYKTHALQQANKQGW